MTSLRLEPYRAQHARWPVRGRHEDITPLVREQRGAFAKGGPDALVTPREAVYPLSAETAAVLRADAPPA